MRTSKVSGTALLVAGLVLGPSTGAHALLMNGGFESVDDRIGLANGNALNNLGGSSPTWDVFQSLPGGWSSLAGDPGIEVQFDGTVVTAHEGNHYVELDSHPGPGSNSAMQQEIALAAGSYQLSFYYRPRTGNAGSDNRIDVSVFNGASVDLTVDFTTADFDEWREFSLDFDAGDGNYIVQFAANGLENTLGGFIDDVRLTRVPAPTTLALLGLGLAGLAFGLRRR